MSCKNYFLMSIVLLLGFSGMTHAGDFYKWTDENGNVHFGDRPQQTDSEKINLKQHNSSSSGSNSNSEMKRQRDRENLLNSMQKDRMQRNAAKQKIDAENKARQQKCNLAKGNLKQYESYGRLFRIDDKGEHHFVTEDERARKKEIARQNIKTWCR